MSPLTKVVGLGLVSLLVTQAGQADQLLLMGVASKDGPGSGTPSYTGPGDAVGSAALAWYGLRAYSASYAGGKSINVRRQSDSTTQDINTLATGGFDIATAQSFAGVDTTASCSTSGASTTLSCTGASHAPASDDQVTGIGIVQPAYVSSCGTFTAGAGTCTLNANQNIASAVTTSFQVALFVTTIYDQTGNGRAFSQGTTSEQPLVLFGCIGGKPCMVTMGNQWLTGNPGVIPTQAVPFTFSTVAENLHQGSQGSIMSQWESPFSQVVFGPTNNQVKVYSGNELDATGVDFVPHAIQAVVNGASSVTNVDNTQTIGNSGTLALSNGNITGIGSDGGNPLQGYVGEAGIWPIGFTSGNQTSVCHNQNGYWGLGLSC